MPSRTQSPAYGSSVSPSRGSLRATMGSNYCSPIVTEPKPLSSIFSTTLPSAQRAGSPYNTQKSSPAALRRMGSANSRSGSASRATSPYLGSASGRMGSPLTMVDGPLTQQPVGSSASPVRSSMTAQPQHYGPAPALQHYGSTLPRSLIHHDSDPYGAQSYDVYERMIPRPDNLTGPFLCLPLCTQIPRRLSRLGVLTLSECLLSLQMIHACLHTAGDNGCVPNCTLLPIQCTTFETGRWSKVVHYMH